MHLWLKNNFQKLIKKEPEKSELQLNLNIFADSLLTIATKKCDCIVTQTNGEIYLLKMRSITQKTEMKL